MPWQEVRPWYMILRNPGGLQPGLFGMGELFDVSNSTQGAQCTIVVIAVHGEVLLDKCHKRHSHFHTLALGHTKAIWDNAEGDVHTGPGEVARQ